jgi:hypothetical protein
VIYIEYISRRPGVTLTDFHEKATAGQSGWAEGFEDDVLLLNLARTWRLGPEPEYLTVWYSPGASLERLDEWQSIFESGTAADVEESFASVARIDAAGCYEPLLEPVTDATGPYYVEYLELGGADDPAALDHVRSVGGTELELVLAVRRIGMLGPEPDGLAFWKLGRFGDLRNVAGRRNGEGPVQVVRSGVYADFGKEIP